MDDLDPNSNRSLRGSLTPKTLKFKTFSDGWLFHVNLSGRGGKRDLGKPLSEARTPHVDGKDGASYN
jgi:hypothetical protein